MGEGGGAIEAEVWQLPAEGLGAARRVAPADGARQRGTRGRKLVTGFLCEPGALEGAEDITSYGGWRAYLRSRT